MNIFFIRPAATDPTAGGHRYDRELASALRALGHEVDEITLHARFPLEQGKAAEEAEQVFSRISGTLGTEGRIVVDGMCLPAFHRLPAQSLRLLTPLIHHPAAAGQGNGCAEKQDSIKAAEQTVLSAISHAVATMDETRSRLIREYGIADARISVVESGFPDCARSPGTRNTDGTSPCRILSTGTIVPRKGFDILLQALARLTDLSWSLTIAGNGQRDPGYLHTLRGQADNAGIGSSIRFIPYPDDTIMQALWAETDLYAQAAWWDGPFYAPLQAARHGVPIAATASKEAALKLPLATGAICAPGDHETLSKVLRRLIFDDALRKKCGQAAWEAGRALPAWPDQARAFLAALPPRHGQ